MQPEFFLSTIRYLAEDATARSIVNAGVSQEDMDILTGPALWTPDLRIRVRRTLDSVVFGITDMAGLPRVEIPAEMAAAIIAMIVNPANWMIAASWLADLKPAQDFTTPEETVQLERVSAGKMFVLVCMADAGMRTREDYTIFASRLQGKFTLKVKAR